MSEIKDDNLPCRQLLGITLRTRRACTLRPTPQTQDLQNQGLCMGQRVITHLPCQHTREFAAQIKVIGSFHGYCGMDSGTERPAADLEVAIQLAHARSNAADAYPCGHRCRLAMW